jgi:glycine cleavage system H lipoate-binding protein
MVVLLVVLTFAVLILVDYVVNREKYKVAAEAAPVREPVMSMPEANTVQGILIPAELYFHPGHTWAAPEAGGLVRVGIDAFAARLLAKTEKLTLPLPARWVRQGDRAVSVSQDGHTAQFVSPVEGEVVQVNRELLANPAAIKGDPYGRGWLMVVKAPELHTCLRNLLSGSLARMWMEDSLDRLRQLFAPTALATAQDGGPMLDGLSAQADAETWKKLNAEFFRSQETAR